MSLIINIISPEGIVMAADSRQTYRNKAGMARIGSDNARKIFQLGERTVIALAGPAFLPENGVPKNVSKFVEDFQRAYELKKMTIEEIANKLKDFFEQKYNYQEQLKAAEINLRQQLGQQGATDIKIQTEPPVIKVTFKDKDGKQGEVGGSIDVLSIIIAGYNHDGSHQAFLVYIPGPIQEKRNSKKRGMEYGANWVGQTDTLVRILKGFDLRMFDVVPFAKDQISKLGIGEIEKQMAGLEYAISWGTMTLQDAVDFSTLVIHTTSAIQRFSDGILASPGDIPGVGGQVDVVVITPDKFTWVSEKKVKVNPDGLNE